MIEYGDEPAQGYTCTEYGDVLARNRENDAKILRESTVVAPQSGNYRLEIGEIWNDGVDVKAPRMDRLLAEPSVFETASPAAPCLTQTQREIVAVCDSIKELLLAKNRAYGDSALNPVRIFSKASAEQQILDRIDDKLSRLARGTECEAVPEDTVRDLIGYLVLLLVARERSRK